METPALNQMQRVSLFEAMLARRSRRFAHGMNLPTGPLAFRSQRAPEPLREDEEAALAFAACGVTGYALAELPYGPSATPESSGGNIMTHFIARTIASGDAMHDCAVFVINDAGTWMLKRPQDYPRQEIPELIRTAHEKRLVDLYQKARVEIADHRVDVPREVPFVAPFNKWMANVPGTTYFLPVAELTALYINVMLSIFDDDFATFVVDDRNGYQPAGIAAFARSAGGTLHDNPADGRVLTVGFIETWICEFVAIEQGAIHQNLGSDVRGPGPRGFPPLRGASVHLADRTWLPNGRGFLQPSYRLAAWRRCRSSSAYARRSRAQWRCLDQAVLPAILPEHGGGSARVSRLQIRGRSGAHFATEAPQQAGWTAQQSRRRSPPYSPRAIDATIAYCRYIHERYGRFPVSSGPFRTVLAFQAHRLDPDFYARFYREEATGNTASHDD